MSAFIPLCPGVKVSSELVLFIPPKVHAQLVEQGVDWKHDLAQISCLKTLLMYREGGAEDYYYLLVTEYGVFYCIRSDRDNLLANNFKRDNGSFRNKALREGITFRLIFPLRVTVNTAEGFHNFHRGALSEYGNNLTCKKALNAINDAFDAKQTPSAATTETESADEESANAAEDATISAQLDALLNTAERYADLDHESVERAAARFGNVHYSAIGGGNTSGEEETCLRFYFSSYDAIDALKTEMVVNLTDENGSILGAEITAKSEPEDEQCFLELTFATAIDIARIPKRGNITLSVSPNVRDTQLAAIGKIRNHPDMLARFERLLTDTKPDGLDEMDEAERRQLTEDFKNRQYPLTDTQIEAVIDGIRARDAYLVMGPPGTGKTTVILEWVKYFVLKKHQRVLIASQNNTAVDNVLKRLANIPEFNLLRLGRAEKVAPELEAMRFQNKLTAARETIVRHTQRQREELAARYERLVEIYKNVELLMQAPPPDNLASGLSFTRHRCELDKRFQVILKATDRLTEYRRIVMKKAASLPNIRNGNGAFGWLPAPIRRAVWEHRKQAIDKARERDESMRQTVNLMIRRYNQYAEALYERQFLAHKQAVEAFNAQLEQVRQLCEHSPELCSLLPREISKKDAAKVAVLKSVLGKRELKARDVVTLNTIIKQELAQLETLIQQLGKWKHDVESAQNYALRNLVLENVNVVGATCISSSNNPFFAEIPYDVVILDEAGQIKIHDCLVPMTRAPKVIMLGDHKQLPPMADPEQVKLLRENGQDTFLYRNSLFEKMYGAFPDENKTMLDTQFRIPKGVADFLSHEFYGDKYQTHPNKAAEQFSLDFLGELPLVLIDTSDSEKRFHQVQKIGDKEVVWNEYESRVAAAVYHKLQQAPYRHLETKILAGLSRQVTEIRDTLKHAKKGAVSTVDSFQGQECDVVIYSFTRSQSTTSEDGTLSVGFLNDLRRLNVAMSRAMKVLVIIGDFSYLDACREVLDRSTGKNKKFAAFIHDLKATTEGKDGNPPAACIVQSGDVLRKTEVADV